jgi:hypothetical protein
MDEPEELVFIGERCADDHHARTLCRGGCDHYVAVPPDMIDMVFRGARGLCEPCAQDLYRKHPSAFRPAE